MNRASFLAPFWAPGAPPKLLKRVLGLLFSAFVAQGVPRKLPRSISVRFLVLFGVSFWEPLGPIFDIGAALGAFWVSFIMLSGGLSLEAGFKSPK